jgi:TetR/AcrR family transcriptional regulator
LLRRETDINNPGKTVEKIITAARKTFAEYGYSGTHVDEIARRAGVNKATLYYQIGDKDTLYARVIHQVLGNIAQNVARAVAEANSPEAKLKAYILFMADAVDRNPELPPIMMRELASGGLHLPRLVTEDMASVLTVLLGILEEGKEKNVFNDVVPFLVHAMIMGSIMLFKMGTPIKDRQIWLPEDLKARDKKLPGTLGAEVARMVLKAVKKNDQ